MGREWIVNENELNRRDSIESRSGPPTFYCGCMSLEERVGRVYIKRSGAEPPALSRDRSSPWSEVWDSFWIEAAN